MSTGTFIVFEGPEGAGKSIQTSRLVALLRTRGHVVVQTREPGGTTIGDDIREILLRNRDYAMLSETEALLMAASRAQHVGEIIRPALARGEIVVCDRYVDSSYAYQGGGRQLGFAALEPIQQFATGGLDPDVRILLDLPVETGLRRRFADPASVNRIDNADISFHLRVRDAYLDRARAYPDAWTIIDASRAIDVVAADVAAAILQRIE